MERRWRIVSGLTMFSFTTWHFISHAIGLFGLDAMDAVGRDILLAPWRTVVG